MRTTRTSFGGMFAPVVASRFVRSGAFGFVAKARTKPFVSPFRTTINTDTVAATTSAFPLFSTASDDDARRLVDTVGGDDGDVSSDVFVVQDWNDRVGLQAGLANDLKGWRVAVEWRDTPRGAGVFAARDVPAGTVMRIGRTGVNLLRFREAEDVLRFCRRGDGDDDHGQQYRARLAYATDYLWGFEDDSSPDFVDYDREDRFVGMWVPGNGLNHDPNPNMVYRAAVDERTGVASTDHGVNLVALRDIEAGEEIYDDYRRHGRSPRWLSDFAKEHNATLNFADCNDFVEE